MVAVESLTEEEQVVRWREQFARSLGYSPANALLIAISLRDLHELEGLIAAGCPLDLALRISRDL